MYTLNFTVYSKKVCLSLHCNGDNSYFFVNGRQIVKFKAKDFEIVTYPLCLPGISKDYMNMFMISVSIIEPLQIITYMVFMLI